MNIDKEFIPSTEAFSLKGLDFDKPCFGFWDDFNGKSHFKVDVENATSQDKVDYVCDGTNTSYLAPLWQQAFDWFREEHGKNVLLFSDGIQWTFDLRWVEEDDFTQSPSIQFPKKEVGRQMFDTYEEARLASLQKLIELVANQ